MVLSIIKIGYILKYSGCY